MTWTHAAASTGSNNASLPLVNAAIGNLIVAWGADYQNATVYPDRPVRRWRYLGAGRGQVPLAPRIFCGCCFPGTATATGAQTVLSPGRGPYRPVIRRQPSVPFQRGSWGFDKQGNLDSAGTASFPSSPRRSHCSCTGGTGPPSAPPPPGPRPVTSTWPTPTPPATAAHTTGLPGRCGDVPSVGRRAGNTRHRCPDRGSRRWHGHQPGVGGESGHCGRRRGVVDEPG